MLTINDVTELAELITKETLDFLITRYGSQAEDIWRTNSQTHIKDGRKYIRLDVGSSGKYMVEKATGIIYGIKAYGVIHKGHAYGTLRTINDWNWGRYTATRKQRRNS